MVLDTFSLKGKVALVTGASYGIGFAIASGLAEAGATICFNDINQDLVDKGIASYLEAGIKAHGYVCDVTNEEAVHALVAKIEEEVGVIDILVNNAGIIKRIPMVEMSAADFRKVIDVDLNAPFICAKAVIPSMIKKGAGKIINICSMMSELGRETVSAYAAAKGGLTVSDIEVDVVASFDDVYAVFMGGNENANTVITYETVGSLTFRYPTSQHMLIYQSGSFYSITEAYQKGILTEENLQALHTTYMSRFSQ